MFSTLNNHLKHKINGDTLTVTLGKPIEPLLSAREELVKTAQIIGNHYKNLKLCMSGGIDSEAMAEAFLLAQVPFEVVTFRYGNGLNDHDIIGVEDFCKKRGVKHQFIDIDAVEYFKSEQYLKYCDQIRIVNPLTALHLACLEKVSGTPVLAWEPPHLDNVIDTGQIIIQLINDYFLGYARYYEASSHQAAVPYFFIHRPELFLALLKTQTYEDVLKKGKSFTDYSLKTSVYKEMGLKASARPEKFTGFEGLDKKLSSLMERPSAREFFIKQMENKYSQGVIQNTIYRIPQY